MKDDIKMSIRVEGEEPVEFTSGDLKSAAERLESAEESRVARKKGMKPDLPVMAEADKANDVGGVSGQRLRTYLDRIERLSGEVDDLKEDIKSVYAESKAFGYSTPTLRQIVKLRRMDEQKRREADELLSLYCSALGMD